MSFVQGFLNCFHLDLKDKNFPDFVLSLNVGVMISSLFLRTFL